MKIELKGKVFKTWTCDVFDTQIDNEPYSFGLHDGGTCLISAVDEIFKKYGEPITESGQSLKIIIERN